MGEAETSRPGNKETGGLRYVGAGAFLLGVPARDLEEGAIAASGHSAEDLIASGLYVPVGTPSAEERDSLFNWDKDVDPAMRRSGG